MSRIISQFVCMAVLATASSVAMAFDGVNLADLTDWDIVVAADAIESEKYAAREFQQLYERASGVAIPIVTSANRTRRHIFIGESDAMADATVGFSTDAMGEEAFRIVITSSHIVIAGGPPRGTLYGVYTFVEDYLGVRFLTADHTHVPPVGEWRGVEPLDRIYDPPLKFRWSYWHPTLSDPVFATRTRCNTVSVDRPDLGEVCKYRLTNHSIYQYMNTEAYGDEHPEYFALIDGKRRAHVEGKGAAADAAGSGTQPCMSNPDVIRIITEKVIEQLRDNPDLHFIQLAQGDNYYYCRCGNCAAIDEREESHMGSLLAGINAVAEAVEEQYPNVVVGTLAYQYSRKPPRHLRARDNVQIQLANIECSITKPLRDPSNKYNTEFVEELTLWQQKAGNISIWTYSTNYYNYLLPCPTLRVWEPNIEFYVAHGVNQLFVQGAYQSPGAAFGELTNYVIGRLLWDPSLDSEMLIDEFLRLHYGRAAPPIRRYLDLFYDHAEAKGIDKNCFGHASDFGVDDTVIQAGLDAYDEAVRLAESDEIRDRLDMVKLWASRAAIEDAWLAVRPHRPPSHSRDEADAWLKEQGVKSGYIDPQVQQRTRAHVRELFRLIRKHNVTYWNETVYSTLAEQMLRYGFGLDESEAW